MSHCFARYPSAPRARRWPLATAATLLALAAGCKGEVGAKGAGGTGSGGSGAGSGAGGSTGSGVVIAPPPSDLPPPSACQGNNPGPQLLRRLSASELTVTIRDLFGDPAVPVATVFNDPPVLGFSVDANALLVQGLTAQQLMDNAEQIAHWAVTNRLTQISPCQSNDAACRQQFIRTFGRRAFRAPLSDARVATYDTLFAAEGSFSAGVEAVISAMLQSPLFLYRGELGGGGSPGAEVALTPHEIASSLSYLLTGSMPDEQLLAAADSGQLSTPEEIDRQTERLLGDPRAADNVMRFMSGWLGLDRLSTNVKDDNVFRLTDALRADMLAETRGLVLDTFNGNGTVADLFTADHSFMNRNLAQYYGMDAGSLGDTPTRVPLAGARRDPGILAHASLLTGYATAGTSSPTQRGRLVRTRLLCQNLPPMPADLDTKLKPPTKTETTRDHYAEHSAVEPCASCHKMMDPVGYGFEHYDAFGRYRDQDNGLPVDATGTIYGMAGGDVAFDGVGELGSYLASRDEVKQCIVRYWAYYAYGSASWSQDSCTYAAIQKDAASSQYALRSVLKGIIHAPHFTRRVQGDL